MGAEVNSDSGKPPRPPTRFVSSHIILLSYGLLCLLSVPATRLGAPGGRDLVTAIPQHMLFHPEKGISMSERTSQ